MFFLGLYLIVSNVLVVITIAGMWSWLEFDSSWYAYGVAWLSAALFYGTYYWLMVERRDAWRQQASLVSVWIVLGIAVLAGIWSSDTSWLLASSGSLLAIATTIATHGYRTGKHTLVEIAVYLATFGLQRMVKQLIPQTNMVVYGHWWALTIALMAVWRSDNKKNRFIAALVFVTGSTGLYAIGGMSGYSLVFLVEHVILLTAGALLRQQWVMWWGISAVVVAVLYFLRGYTFLALLFLGFLLILFVVWRLTKMGKKQSLSV